MGCFLHALKNYANFSGRASRKEFWMFVLFYVLTLIAAAIVDMLTGLFNEALGLGVFSGFLLLFYVLPSLALYVRRFHDLGHSGWWVLLLFVPLVGIVVFIYVGFFKGTEGPNDYGDAAPAC